MSRAPSQRGRKLADASARCALAGAVALAGWPFAAAVTSGASTPALAGAGAAVTAEVHAVRASAAEPAATAVTASLVTTTSLAPELVAARLLADCIGTANAVPGLVWKATLLGGGYDMTEFSHAGRLDGTEVITGYRDSKRVLMNLVVIGARAYAWGNAGALETLLGLKASAAATQAGRWLLVPQAGFSQAYQTLAAGLTVSSATQVLDLVGKLSLLPERAVDHQEAIGVRGTSFTFGVPGTQTVYVRAVGTPLPVELVESYGRVLETVTFGQWGQPPKATPPERSIPFQRSWLR